MRRTPAPTIAAVHAGHPSSRRRADDRHARDVEPAAARHDGARHPAGARRQADQAERHVDEEDHAPAGAEDVALDEQGADDRADDGRQAHDRAEQAEGPLQHAQADERAGRPGQGARRRGEGEAGSADQERAPAAEGVAQPDAGDEQDGQRERVAGAQPLQEGLAPAEALADGGAADLGDRRVDEVHDVTGPNALACAESMLGLLLAGGVDPRRAAWALDALFLLITANAIETVIAQQRTEAGGESPHTRSACGAPSRTSRPTGSPTRSRTPAR